MQFALVSDNPFTRITTRSIIALGAALLITNVVLALLQVIGIQALAIVGLFALLTPLGIIWNIRKMNQGVCKLTPTNLIVDAPAMKQLYSWTDISAVRIATLADSGVLDRICARATFVDLTETFVELRLRKSARLTLFGWRGGTRVAGIPSVLHRTARLHVADPSAFVAAVQGQLEQVGAYAR